MNNRKRQIHACEKGDIETVKQICSKRKGITWNLVEIACKNGHLNIVKYLIKNEEQHKREIKFEIINEMLIIVCSNGFYGILKFLLYYCEKYNNCIIKLIKNMLINVIQKGIDYNRFNFVKYILEYCTRNKYIFDNTICGKDSIFLGAYEKGYIKIVKYIIDYCEQHRNKIDLVGLNIQICLYAFLHGHLDKFKYIIEYSEKINNRLIIYISDRWGFSDIRFYTHFINLFKYILYLHKHNYKLNIMDLVILNGFDGTFTKKYNNTINNKYMYNNNIISYDKCIKNRVYNFNLDYIVCLSFF